MFDLHNLYQEVIIDHNQRPRNCRLMPDADGQARGYNPLCGDQVTVYLKLDDDVILDASFQGCGCAISTASASLMTEFLKGKSLQEAQEMFGLFHHALLDKKSGPIQNLGKLEALLGVKEFPSRVKCATLAWHALHDIIKKHITEACDAIE